MSRFEQKVIALLVPLALVFAWAGGKARVKETITQKLSNISSDIQGIVKIDEYLYQGNSRENPEETFYFAYDTRPSYGGPLRVAVAVNSKDRKSVV